MEKARGASKVQSAGTNAEGGRIYGGGISCNRVPWRDLPVIPSAAEEPQTFAGASYGSAPRCSYRRRVSTHRRKFEFPRLCFARLAACAALGMTVIPTAS